ncbi:MAG: DUF6076 domain-containing protein, partial [Oscillospiraceae bacterium]|nr:DUF6076 domain-containing protein [Oscillospiraceae bacterium]
LIDGEALTLSFFEFACDLANLKSRGWINKKYKRLPLNEIQNELCEICRYTTAGILTVYLQEYGKKALSEISELANLAFDHVSKYLRVCYDQNPENEQYVKKLLTNLISSIESSFLVTFRKINEDANYVFLVDTLKHLLYFDFYHTGKVYYTTANPIKIKKCQNCGRYFVVKGRSDTLYCDYPAPQNQNFNCNDPHMLRFYGDSETEIEIKKRRHRIFTTWQTRLRNHPEDTTAQFIFENFKTRDAEIKLAIENGLQTESQYYEFLKNYPTPSTFKGDPEAYLKAIEDYDADSDE